MRLVARVSSMFCFDGIEITRNAISPDYASSTPIWMKWAMILFLALTDQVQDSKFLRPNINT